jgi:tetratricopeptide (TPR) repeat protein
MSLLYFDQAEYPKALKKQLDALKIFTSLKDSLTMARVLNSIGISYMYMSDYDKALDSYFQALRIYDLHGESKTILTANLNINIGLNYKNLGKYKEALVYQHKAYLIMKLLDDQSGMAACLGNMATLYDFMGEPQKSIALYEQALHINQEIKNKRGVASCLINLGIVYHGMEKYQKSMEYLYQSLPIYRDLGDKFNESINLDYIASNIVDSPDQLLAQYDILPSERLTKALNYQRRSTDLARATTSILRQSEAWKNMSHMYELQKDFSNALNAYKQYISFYEKIYDAEKKEALSKKIMQFEFEKKEALLKAEADKKQALATAEIQRQQLLKNVFLGGSLFLILFTSIGYFLYKRKRDADIQKSEAEFKALVAETEMKALRSQMNPHFIFNSLNSISYYILKNDIATADAYLSKFAKVMRKILENSEQKQISLAEDIEVLELYIQLESARLNHLFTYEINIDPAIDQDITLIPPLLLQPFVENSIWHGLQHRPEKGWVKIDVKKDDDMIYCAITDNGIGRQEHILTYTTNGKEKSLGMKITNARIEILNRIKNAQASVTVTDLIQGVHVEIKLPLELKF